jgi:hypothetical protein
MSLWYYHPKPCRSSDEKGVALPLCYFVSDLHGKKDNYLKLFERILDQRPKACPFRMPVRFVIQS